MANIQEPFVMMARVRPRTSKGNLVEIIMTKYDNDKKQDTKSVLKVELDRCMNYEVFSNIELLIL